jgi:hypothetical protein
MAIVDAATGAVEAAPSMLDALNALPADMQCGGGSTGTDGGAGRVSAVAFVATAPALVSWHAATQRTILLVPGVLQQQDMAPGATSSSGTATSSSSSTTAVTTSIVSVAAFALAPRGSTTSLAPPRLTALWCAPLPSSVGNIAPVTAQMALVADAARNATVVVVPTAAGIYGLGV